MPIHLTCSICDAALVRKPSAVKARNYCSLTCHGAAITEQGKQGITVEVSDDGLTARVALRNRAGTVRAYATVDADDASWVAQWPWCFSGGYACRYVKESGKTTALLMHRELMGLPPGPRPLIDHVNRDRSDNRRSNLRIATHADNMQNRPSHRGSTSQYRGVYWDAHRNRWRAAVTVNGRQHRLGNFSNEQDAAAAVKSARLRLMPFAVD